MHILVPVYVLFYTVIMRFMLLNLVLSVILDRFTDSATYEGLLSTDNFFDVSAHSRVAPSSVCFRECRAVDRAGFAFLERREYPVFSVLNRRCRFRGDLR